VRNRPCKLKGFLIECGSRAPEDVPKSKLAKAKASVAITCSPLPVATRDAGGVHPASFRA